MPDLPAFPDAVIALANYARFKPGQQITNPCVYSRMFLWVIAGKGTVTINKEKYKAGPGDFWFLPWRHRIRYRADQKEPFHLAGIHLIPYHGADREIDYRVAHSIRHPLAGLGWRRNRPLPGLEGIITGSLRTAPALAELADYIVQLYRRHDRKDRRMRRLAELFLQELGEAAAGPDVQRTVWPPELQALLDHIDRHLDRPLTLKNMAATVNRGTATVGRIFRQHLDCTPVEWITRLRMEKAKYLLSTSMENIEEVGRAIGVPDPYYFSKLFKKHAGVSPMTYRKSRQRI